MKTQSSSNRTLGFILTLAGLVLGWAGTYNLLGAPTLPWSTFPAIPLEYFSSVGPFNFSGIILIWLVSVLFAVDGISLLLFAKRSEFLRTGMFPLVGIALWVVPVVGLMIEAGFSAEAVICGVLVSGALGARYTAKII